MFCLTHPQMMAVHKLMLGPEVRHDHNTLLFRKEGFPGPTPLPHYRTNPCMPPRLHAAPLSLLRPASKPACCVSNV